MLDLRSGLWSRSGGNSIWSGVPFWWTGEQFGFPRSASNGDGWLPSGSLALVLQRFEAVFLILANRPKRRLVTVHAWWCHSLFFVRRSVLGCSLFVFDSRLGRAPTGSLISEESQ